MTAEDLDAILTEANAAPQGTTPQGIAVNQLESKTENIGKIFSSDFFFRIPDYQRPFAWDEENFADLVDDLIAAQGDKQYFLGTLVLHKKDDKNNYDVVDGQQRLTTLLILLACMRDILVDADFKRQLQGKIIQEANKVDGIPEKPRIEVKDRATFREFVLDDKGTTVSRRADDLLDPGKRYLQAVQVFRERFLKMSQENLQRFVQFVNQKCVLIYLSTTTFDDAFKLFTIVNDRGKQLRRIDILKAQNISPQAIVSQTTRERVAQEWETMENELGDSTMESILYAIRLIHVKDKPQEDLLKEFENRIFKKGLLAPGEKFVDEVISYGKLYRSIFVDKDYLPEDDAFHLRFKAMIHIMNQEFEASEWRACLMFFAKRFNGGKFYQFMLAIEKVYLSDWVRSIRKDERFETYSKILKAIESSATADEAISKVTYDKGIIESAVVHKNFYNAGHAKYFLLRLEVLASENDAHKEFSAKSIEHVFPQTPKAGSGWASDPNFSEHGGVVNTIGNLVLLSKGKNSAASNHDFDTKKSKYLKDRVSDYPRSIQIINEPDWTIAKIKAKTTEIQSIILNDP